MFIKDIICRLIKATKHSLQGLLATFQNEWAFRFECYIGIVVIPLAIYLADSLIEYLLLIGSWLLLLIVELLNSGIEAVVDRISEQHHELSGRAKDCGSAAVFITVICASLVWSAILVRHCFLS